MEARAASCARPEWRNLDFEGVAPVGGFDIPGSYVFSNLTITSPTNRIGISDSGTHFATPTDVLFDDTFGGQIILSFGPGVNAVGFNATVGFSAGDGFFEIYNGLTLLDSRSIALANQNDMTSFVGWSGLGDIKSIRFFLGSNAFFPLIDNLQYAQVVAVPEPATMALFGAGLLGLGLLSRRRKCAAA